MTDKHASAQVPPGAAGPGVPAVLITAARLLWCCAGASVGLGLVLGLVDPPTSPLLLASLGGTAVFLFGLTRAAAAQPRALFGGHLLGAVAGIVCYATFGDAPWVYAAAVLLALVLMLSTRSVHPPAGANPMIMVHAHAGFAALWHPVGLSVLVLAVTAALWSRLLPGTLRYPAAWMDPSPPAVTWGAWEP